MVSDAHISALVFARYADQVHGPREDAAEDRRTGQMLIRENYLSVACRYPDKVKPLDDAFVEAFRPTRPTRKLTPVQLIKAVHCYCHQANEHQGWGESAAKVYCDDLLKMLSQLLPGYDDAPWALEASDLAAPPGGGR